MKMRKITSFVLTLALVLGSFSMAFAATPATSAGLTDIAGVANEEAIQVNYDLGIITGNPDGTFLPTKAVNRAEFAAMMTRALAVPASALAGYTSTTFKDTVGYGWAVPYLAFCQSKGIMIGDGMGNVMPGRTINVNEAMTMVLRAVGYTENSSMLVGTWPSKYVTVAQNLGLYDDVATAVNVDKANAAQIIYNALTVQKVTVNADGTTTYVTIDDPDSNDSADRIPATLLNTGLNSMSSEEVVEYTEDSLINLSKYIGANANVYRNDGGDGDIVAVEVLSVFLTGEYDGDGTFEADNGNDYNVSDSLADPTTETAIYFDNARADGTWYLADAATDETVTIAVDVTGKTIKEIYSISEWFITDAVVATTGDIEDLDDQQFAGADFTLDDNDDIDMNSFMLVGATSVDKIAKDDVVYIYESGDMITKLAVGTDVITEKKVTESDGDDYTIGGAVYNLADNGFEDIEMFSVSDTINAKLDAYGDIFTLEVVVGTPDMYGVVTAYSPAGFDDAKVKLYTNDDATKTFNIDSDADEVLVADTLIGYGLDKDGVIDSIDNSATTADAVTLSSIKVINVDGTTHAVSTDVVVFTFDGTDYAVIDIADVETGVDLASIAGIDCQVIVDEDGYVVAMVIDADAAGTADTGNYAVINKEVVAINADDDVVQKLTGFMDGAAFTKLTDGDVVAFNDGNLALWDLEMNASGVITDGTLVSADVNDETIMALNSDKTAVSAGGIWSAIASNAVVYVAEEDTDGVWTYEVSSLASLRTDYMITLFETDSDYDGYDIVIFEKAPVM